MNIESVILHNLCNTEDYARRVMPYLKDEYFFDSAQKILFSIIKDYFIEYNVIPNKTAIDIEINNNKSAANIHSSLKKMNNDIFLETNEKYSQDWLLKNTEQFCKDQSLVLALQESILISTGENKQLSTTAIPDILSQALAVSFNTNIGHDYFSDSEKRLEYYNQKVNKIPFHLDMLNTITNGGIERKTVNAILAGTGVGKSMLLCDLAGGYIKAGYNVLYITLEMAEEKIAQRIDANLLNTPLIDFENISKETFTKKISDLQKKCIGKLKIKEYPTSSAHVGHFRHLLKELKIKQNFIPDILIVDYLNICTSSRFKDKSNSYGFIKSICEELRGLAVQENIAVFTASQLNRGGMNNSDVDLTHTSESTGMPFTFDMIFALISTEELASMNQIMVKQLKNRYGDIMQNSKFVIGIDRSRMKFFNLTNSSPINQFSQQNLSSGNSGNTLPGINKRSKSVTGITI